MRILHGCIAWVGFVVVGLVLMTGCGDQSGTTGDSEKSSTPEAQKSADSKQAAAMPSNDPVEVVRAYLAGAQNGDDSTVNMLLTPIARAEMAKRNFRVAPPASDTTRFELGKVNFPNEKVAYVPCRLSDQKNATSSPSVSEIVWALRKTEEGWRIGGMAIQVVKDAAPLMLDFEKPEEIMKTRKAVKAQLSQKGQASPNRQGAPASPARGSAAPIQTATPPSTAVAR